MHERPSSRGQPTLHYERVPCSEEHLRNCRRVGHPDGDRNSHQLPFVRGDLFGIGAACLDAHHLVTGLPHRDPLANRLDGSGELEPRDLERRRSRIWIHAHRLQEIGAIQCGRPHSNHGVLGTTEGIGDVFDRQRIRTTMRPEYDSAHRRSLPSTPPRPTVRRPDGRHRRRDRRRSGHRRGCR